MFLFLVFIFIFVLIATQEAYIYAFVRFDGLFFLLFVSSYISLSCLAQYDRGITCGKQRIKTECRNFSIKSLCDFCGLFKLDRY